MGMTRVHRFETKPVGPFGRRISCQWGTDPTSSSSLPGWRLDSGALRGGASSDDDMGRNVGGRCDGVGVDVRPRQEAEAENGESEESTEGPRAAPDRRGVTHVVLLVDSAGGMPVRHTICWNAHPPSAGAEASRRRRDPRTGWCATFAGTAGDRPLVRRSGQAPQGRAM